MKVKLSFLLLILVIESLAIDYVAKNVEETFILAKELYEERSNKPHECVQVGEEFYCHKSLAFNLDVSALSHNERFQLCVSLHDLGRYTTVSSKTGGPLKCSAVADDAEHEYFFHY